MTKKKQCVVKSKRDNRVAVGPVTKAQAESERKRLEKESAAYENPDTYEIEEVGQ